MTDRSIDTRDRTEPAQVESEPSLGDLFGQLSQEFSQLMRQEVQLAKTELGEETAKAGKAAGQLTGAAVTGLLFVLLASLAAAWALGEVMPVAVGLLIVAAVHGVAAVAFYASGRSQAARIEPVPDETIETLKEDTQWAKQQLR